MHISPTQAWDMLCQRGPPIRPCAVGLPGLIDDIRRHIIAQHGSIKFHSWLWYNNMLWPSVTLGPPKKMPRPKPAPPAEWRPKVGFTPVAVSAKAPAAAAPLPTPQRHVSWAPVGTYCTAAKNLNDMGSSTPSSSESDFESEATITPEAAAARDAAEAAAKEGPAAAAAAVAAPEPSASSSSSDSDADAPATAVEGPAAAADTSPQQAASASGPPDGDDVAWKHWRTARTRGAAWNQKKHARAVEHAQRGGANTLKQYIELPMCSWCHASQPSTRCCRAMCRPCCVWSGGYDAHKD